MTTTPGIEPRHRREARGLRVGTVLLLVAIVPLLGVAAVTWNSIGAVQTVADAAARTEELTQAAVELAELNAAAFEEMVWMSVTSVMDAVDAPGEVIRSVIGGDPHEQLSAAIERTDETAAVVARSDLTTSLQLAREGERDFGEVLADYGAIAASTETSLAELLAELTTAATGSEGADDLAHSLTVLELAVEHRSAMAEQFYGFFATTFDVRGTPSQEISRLITQRDRATRALSALVALPPDTPQLAAAIDTLMGGPELAGFNSAVGELIATSLDDGVPVTAAPVELDALVRNADGLTSILTATNASTEAMMVLLDHAVDEVLAAARQVRSDADREILRTYGLAVILTLTSFLTALLAARFIVRPLRALRQAAGDLQEKQDRPAPAPVGGPAEVRAAAQAIQDASGHLHLVTRQARALAAGVLDSEVLDEQAPGGLGDALQHAVGTLRAALTQQDDFRRRLAHEAAHDGLTKLANRNASMAQLTRSLARTTRSGGQLAVMFIDLDRFKDINDLHGHQAGDAVLTTIAHRLVTSVREGDHVGRLGGDEFVVIAEPVSDIEETVALAQRILDTLTGPIDVTTARVTIGASIGIAIADGDHLTADELLRDADLAVYRAKAVGRGGIEICDEDLRNALAETADLTAALRQAIEQDELLLHYQPIVDTNTQQLHALEALVRWRRPGEDALVPPDKFIGFAERSALIVDLDRWVLDAVARQIASWKSDPDYGGVPVAINVSGRHLAHDHFVRHVLEPLATHGVDPRGIIIEVTESALLDDLASASVKLQQLRDAGVLISIDDFGTGYTSLAHLRSLPVDILKIDRSFTANTVTNAHEASIVKLIIDTGHLLGATITAEGIETVKEAAKLTGMGTDNLQGFYFARPQPPERLPRGAIDTTARLDG